MRFIVVDGLDGAGKDTHAQLIKERYERMGERVVLRSHPEDDNPYGRKAKEALVRSGRLNHLKATIYYTLDVIRSIRRYYRKDSPGVLIVVRYLVGVAYLPYPLAWLLYRFFSTILPTSPYMFFLDAPPEEAMRRIERRSEREMFENPESLLKVRRRALRLVRGWHIIDTTGSVEETRRKIEEILDRLDRESESIAGAGGYTKH